MILSWPPKKDFMKEHVDFMALVWIFISCSLGADNRTPAQAQARYLAPDTPRGATPSSCGCYKGVCIRDPFWFLLLMAEILHQLIGSLSHYLQGLIHPRWCRISAINSSSNHLLLESLWVLRYLTWMCSITVECLEMLFAFHSCHTLDFLPGWHWSHQKAPGFVESDWGILLSS